MATDFVDHIMVASIHEVGHALGIQTIAEFVEDNATLQALQSIGVDFAQGFAIAKPRPLSELELDQNVPVITPTYGVPIKGDIKEDAIPTLTDIHTPGYLLAAVAESLYER